MNACCEDANNLVPTLADDPDVRPGLLLRRCSICSNRHFTLTVDPIVLDVMGQRL